MSLVRPHVTPPRRSRGLQISPVRLSHTLSELPRASRGPTRPEERAQGEKHVKNSAERAVVTRNTGLSSSMPRLRGAAPKRQYITAAADRGPSMFTFQKENKWPSPSSQRSGGAAFGRVTRGDKLRTQDTKTPSIYDWKTWWASNKHEAHRETKDLETKTIADHHALTARGGRFRTESQTAADSKTVRLYSLLGSAVDPKRRFGEPVSTNDRPLPKVASRVHASQWLEDAARARKKGSLAPPQQRLAELESLTRRFVVREEVAMAFNTNSKDGLAIAASHGLVRLADPVSIGGFLSNCPGLNPVALGEFLGTADPRVTSAYAATFDFKGLDFLAATVRFLKGIQVPQDHEMVDRLDTAFCARYKATNPEFKLSLKASQHLWFATVLLDVGLHHKHPPDRMTHTEFRKSCKDATAEGFSKKDVTRIFRYVVKRGLHNEKDYVQRLYDRQHGGAGSIRRSAVGLMMQGRSVERCIRAQTAASQRAGDAKRGVEGKGAAGDAPFGVSTEELQRLLKGTRLTRHYRYSRPKLCNVWLSSDGSQVCVQDAKGSRSVSKYDCTCIADVRVGHDASRILAKAVKKSRKKRPAAATAGQMSDHACFAVEIRNKRRSDRVDQVLSFEGGDGAAGARGVSLWVHFFNATVLRNRLLRRAGEVSSYRSQREVDSQKKNREWQSKILPRWSKEIARPGTRLRRIWLSGLPPSARSVAWPAAIGNQLHITTELIRSFGAQARETRRLGRWRAAVEALDVDLKLTYPDLGMLFQSSEPGMLGEPLRRLLETYVSYRPDIGYMHGMARVAAQLLLYLDFETAFSAFANLMHTPLLLAALRMDPKQIRWRCGVFVRELRRRLPAVAQHFSELALTPDKYLVKWSLSLLSDVLPIDISCKIIDHYLIDGEVVVLRAGIAFLTYFADVLERASYADCIALLTSDGSTERATSWHIDEHKFWPILMGLTQGKNAIRARDMDAIVSVATKNAKPINFRKGSGKGKPAKPPKSYNYLLGKRDRHEY